MKKTMILVSFLLAVLLLSACVPTARTAIQIGPDFSGSKGDYELDFVQLHNDVLGSFDGENPFAFITGLDIDGNNGERKISVNATALPDISAEDAGCFMAAVLRYTDDAASTQDSRIEVSDSQNFGSLYSLYSVSAKVVDEAGTEIASWDLPAGSGIPLDANIEAYYEEWEKAIEIYRRNNQ